MKMLREPYWRLLAVPAKKIRVLVRSSFDWETQFLFLKAWLLSLLDCIRRNNSMPEMKRRTKGPDRASCGVLLFDLGYGLANHVLHLFGQRSVAQRSGFALAMVKHPRQKVRQYLGL